MNYSKEQIKDLINYLKNYKDTFKVLIDFFEDHYNKGHFDLGFNVPGNQNAAVIIKEMEYLFPDILYTMFLSEKDLPLFVNNGICNLHEHIIASWRLSREHTSPIKHWYNKKGKLHREEGPAIELSNGNTYWYKNDLLHREDGPAIEGANKSWYLNDKVLTEDLHKELTQGPLDRLPLYLGQGFDEYIEKRLRDG